MRTCISHQGGGIGAQPQEPLLILKYNEYILLILQNANMHFTRGGIGAQPQEPKESREWQISYLIFSKFDIVSCI
jgi:hypothetical protein